MLLIQATIFFAVAIPVFTGVQLVFEVRARKALAAAFMARLESIR